MVGRGSGAEGAVFDQPGPELAGLFAGHLKLTGDLQLTGAPSLAGTDWLRCAAGDGNTLSVGAELEGLAVVEAKGVGHGWLVVSGVDDAATESTDADNLNRAKAENIKHFAAAGFAVQAIRHHGDGFSGALDLIHPHALGFVLIDVATGGLDLDLSDENGVGGHGCQWQWRRSPPMPIL